MPTMKLLPVRDPDAVTVHEGVVAKLAGVIVHVPASEVEKPVPVTVIVVPAGPEFPVRVIVGPFTVKTLTAESPELPAA